MDNTSIEMKAAMRRIAKKGVKQAHVLDLYAGSGEMRKRVWNDAATYYGVDQRAKMGGNVLRADNYRVLMRLLERREYNIFDLDAYSFPWLVADAIVRWQANHRRESDFWMILTDNLRWLTVPSGSRRKLWLFKVADVRFPETESPWAIRFYDDLVWGVLKSWEKYGIQLRSAHKARPLVWQAHGALTRYFTISYRVKK
jgi:hypothetical protein